MTRSAGPLELEEIRIPYKQDPNPPMPADTWGINIAAITAFSEGLLVEVPPWGDTMRVGDSVSVRLNTNVVASGFISDVGEIGKFVQLFIDAEQLITSYFTLDYVVTQPGVTPQPSFPTLIYVKRTRPGGRDEDGSIPGHSELHMEIPGEILLGGVDADTPFVPITIKSPVAGMPPYPYIAEGDRIRLYWANELVEHTVTYEEANDPDTHPIVITVEKEVIDEVGDTDEDGLPVAFFIRDVVNNDSEDWSAKIYIVVDTGSSKLIAPIIEEAVSNVLDLDSLPNPDTVTARVMAMNLIPGRTDFASGDDIEMRLRGVTLDGETVDRVYELKTIASVPGIVDIPLPSIDLRLLVNTQVVLSYRLIKADGSDDLFSKSQFIQVIGEATQLAAPIAEDAIAGTLDPALPRTLIQIPWDKTMAEGQAIDLKWFGIKANTQIYFPTFELYLISHGEELAKEPIYIQVDGEHLRAIEGGTLELFYLLLRDTEAREVVTRQSLHADILNIGEPVAELPPPMVEREQDGVLDPADVPAGTRLIVQQYTGQIRGDVVHYVWNGSKTGIKTDSTPITEINETSNIPFNITFDLIKNNEGGTVKASYWVKRVTGRNSPSEVLPMNIGAALELIPPTLDSVKDGNEVEIPGGEKTVSLTLKLSGTASKGQDVEIYDGNGPSAEPKGQATADPITGIWTKDINVVVGERRLYAKALYPVSPVYSNVHLLEVVDLVVPTLIDIRDSKGSVVDGSTVETSVTVTGTGSRGQEIQLMDGATNIGSPFRVPADSTTWSTILSGLTEKAYSIKARALYGTGVPDSAAKNFNITTVELIPPTLDSVKGGGIEISDGETTVSLILELSGRASKGLNVEIYDGNGPSAEPKGEATANANTGIWTRSIDVDLGARRLYAKALYPVDPYYSNVRLLKVVDLIVPTLTDIRDSKGSVVDGSTTETSVTVTGTGSSGQYIQLMDGATSIGSPVKVPDTGTTWSTVLTGLTAKDYSLKAKALYGSGQESAAKTFNVTTGSAPTLIDIRDSKGSVVDKITVETSVTVTGTGTSGQEIQLMDGATNIGSSFRVPDNSTTWSTVLNNLTAKTYSIKARPLYGNGLPDSAAKGFKVTAAVNPTITDIRDSKGTVVDKITVETSVTVTGTGTSGQEIQLLDGTANIGSSFRVPDNSTTWSTVLNNLTAKTYSIKARPLYGNGLPDSAAKDFKVTAAVNPTITDIRDTKGSVVGKTTVETSVTVTGTGSSGQQIQLMNGSANIGNPFTIPETGTTWSILLTGLAPNAYSIKAKALYGTGVPDSAAKGFTVTELLKPAITNVGTSSGAEVPEGSVTDQVNVTLFGTASKSQSVEIFDVNTSKGTTDVNGSGNWSMHQNGMEQGFHSFTAKGLYGNNPVSDARTFTVGPPAETPTITSLHDNQNVSIPNNGSTVSTTVTLTGTATAGQKVKIIDGTTVLPTDYPVGINRDWSAQVNGLSFAPHQFKAQGQYATNPESSQWNLTVYQGSSGGENWEAQPDFTFISGQVKSYPSGLAMTLAYGESAPNFGATQVRRLNFHPGRGVTLVGNAQMRLNLPGMARYFGGTVVGIHRSGNYAVFFDPTGQNIGTLQLPVTNDGYQTVEFRAPPGTVIAALDIVAVRDPNWPVDVGWSIADVQWQPYI